MKGKLTVKKGQFAQEYAVSGNACEAFRKAGYSMNMSPDSLKSNAWKLAHDPLIEERVAEIQKQMAEENKLTQEEVIQRFRHAYEVGEKNKQSSAMSQAASGLMKMGGFGGENITVRDEQPLPKPPDLENSPNVPEATRKMLKESREREDGLMEPENIIRAVKADPEAAKALAEWEEATRRSKRAKAEGKADPGAILDGLKAKSRLLEIVEASAPQEPTPAV